MDRSRADRSRGAERVRRAGAPERGARRSGGEPWRAPFDLHRHPRRLARAAYRQRAHPHPDLSLGGAGTVGSLADPAARRAAAGEDHDRGRETDAVGGVRPGGRRRSGDRGALLPRDQRVHAGDARSPRTRASLPGPVAAAPAGVARRRPLRGCEVTVERLTGIDASFLYMETPTLHMHTIKVAVLEPSPDVDYSIGRVKADLRERLHLLPPFRRRVIEVPFGLHHPVWIEDPTFDLDRHVRRAVLPSPGGARELDCMISRVASAPLDRRCPLWELWFVEGLAGGRVAAVAKIHHAVADGVAVAGLLANVMAPGLSGLAEPAREARWMPEVVPSRARLLRDALRDHRRQVRRLPALVRRTLNNLRAVSHWRNAAAVTPPLPLRDTPQTSFNGSLTARRTFVSTALPLDEIGLVRRTFGVTLNDVLLAVVAGTLRARLDRRRERPARPRVAEVPVATDPSQARRLAGNRLSNIFTSLCTDVADPVTRLRAIHDVMASAKSLHGVLGPDLFEAWMQYAPPKLSSWWMRLYAGLHVVNHHRPPVNVIVSCVPGPRAELGWPGGTIEAIYSVGPIIEGTALNFTAWTYVDRLCVGALTCPDVIPDLPAIVEGLHDALADLVVAAAATGVRGSGTAALEVLEA